MKTLQPLILTARIAERDLEPFNLMRQAHFPPARNFLAAHLTMFHRLPGEYRHQIEKHLVELAAGQNSIPADVIGIRHISSGVAFAIDNEDLKRIHARLRLTFSTWLGGQDMQRWQPHITIQNKVSRQAADNLHETLMASFRPHPIEIVGFDLWRYLDGPWAHETCAMFGALSVS